MYTMEKNKKVLIKKIEQIFKIIQINQKNLSKERIWKHNQKPEVGTKKLKYAQKRPEVKAKKKQNMLKGLKWKQKKQKYAQRPEVKARKREYYQKWHQKK